jgi:hypothetical protein
MELGREDWGQMVLTSGQITLSTGIILLLFGAIAWMLSKGSLPETVTTIKLPGGFEITLGTQALAFMAFGVACVYFSTKFPDPSLSPPTCHKFEGTYNSSAGQTVKFEPQSGCSFKASITSPTSFNIAFSEAKGTAGIDSAVYQVTQRDASNCTVYLRGWIFDIQEVSYRIFAIVDNNAAHCKNFDADWHDNQMLIKE